MLKITYKDYLRYEKLYGKVEKNNKIFELREDEVDYSYDKNNEHDKVIRDILMIKEEALSLINKVIKNEKEIKEEISLIDVNKYSNEELLQEDNILSKVMLLEKSRNEIEFIKNVERVLQNTNDKNIEKLKDIIIYKSYDALKKEELEEILEKIKERREEEIMTLGERIRRNEREEKMRIAKEAREEGIRVGRQEKLEVINTTIRRMLTLKLDEKIIKEVTGAKDTELEKIKKELLEA